MVWICSDEQLPPKDAPFWAYLYQTGIRKMNWCDDHEGAYVEVDDEETSWEPSFWLPIEAISEPLAHDIIFSSFNARNLKAVTFDLLRLANDSRQQEWPGSERADVAFRAIEVAGEFGEVSEAVKKYLRGEREIKGSKATVEDVADEMADAIIALDLLASEMNIDLGAAVAQKFNRTSVKYNLKTRLPETVTQ